MTINNMSYLESGFDENLIRQSYDSTALIDGEEATAMYDSANIGELMGDNSVGGSTISGITADKIFTGKVGFVPVSGSSGLLIDADNNRFVVNDGTNDRVLLGYLAGKF